MIISLVQDWIVISQRFYQIVQRSISNGRGLGFDVSILYQTEKNSHNTIHFKKKKNQQSHGQTLINKNNDTSDYDDGDDDDPNNNTISTLIVVVEVVLLPMMMMINYGKTTYKAQYIYTRNVKPNQSKTKQQNVNE